MDFILHGDICYSKDKTTIDTLADGYVVCLNGVSCGVYETIPEAYSHLPVKDYKHHLIMPGMVDLHIHAPQYAFRGMGMDLELLDWLNQQAFVEETKYQDLAYAERAYTLFASKMQSSATTRACIFGTLHREATLVLMEKLEATGLISYVGKVNMDRNAPEGLCEADADRSIAETVQWLKDSRRFKRTMPILTPRFIPSCSDALMKQLGELQREYQLPVQSHLSENKGEIDWVKALRPEAAFYGDAYDRDGLFGDKDTNGKAVPTIMAHCVWSEADEMLRMKENGVYVAHCPASNMNLSSGIAPIRSYLDAGLFVGLASDVAGGHTESLFCAIADAIQVSKLYWRYVDDASKPVTFEEAFYMATRGGGAFFGKVGSFAAGYDFDAVILDDGTMPHPQDLTIRQRLERAVYLELDQTAIVAKYVAGESVLQDA